MKHEEYTLCCAVDANPRLHVELVLWLTCVGLSLPPGRDRVVIYVVDSVPEDLMAWLQGQNCELRRLAAPIIQTSPFCNKIAPLLDGSDSPYTIVCDTDLYFVGDFAVFLNSDRVRAAPNNQCNPPPRIFRSVLAASGLDRHYRPGVALIKGREGLRETHINNISAGFVAVPARMSAFGELWRKWAGWLSENDALLEKWDDHVDQVAFALTMENIGEDVEFLPPQVNAILHCLPEFDTIHAFHLSSAHIPRYPNLFNEDRTLNLSTLNGGVAQAAARLNVAIRAAGEAILGIPSLAKHWEMFLNPGWRRPRRKRGQGDSDGGPK